MIPLSREQSRDVDRIATEELGVPSIVLMENAGRGVADILCELGAVSPVMICCGRGNNAGDGFVIARHLDLRGIRVRVLLFASAEQLAGDARTNFEILHRCGIAIVTIRREPTHDEVMNELADANWIVDALLGTGARGAPRPPYDVAIAAMQAHGAPILAVDLPSGFDCDTGSTPGPVIRAEHTCTFVASKLGFQSEGAEAFTGKILVLDIGVRPTPGDEDSAS